MKGSTKFFAKARIKEHSSSCSFHSLGALRAIGKHRTLLYADVPVLHAPTVVPKVVSIDHVSYTPFRKWKTM